MTDLLRRRFLTLVGLAVAALGLAAPADAQWSGGRSRSAQTLTVDLLDVGQGDAILVRSPEGKTALIDAGPTRDGAVQALRRKGIESIDLVVVTHHHLDHHGGMEAVIREFRPKYFLATNSSHTSKSYLKLLQTVKSENTTAVVPTAKPRRIELGSVTLTVLPQPPEDPKEENDNSIGIRIQYGGFSMLTTGDSEPPSRQWWAANCPELMRDCSVLKLAHHGSHNGTDAALLDLVRPEMAVVSLGKGNSYGHPHSETLDLLRRTQIPLVRTDEWGTITLVSDGETWNLVSSALARRRAPRGDAVVAGGASESGSSRASSRRR
ncbi:ComEC/Rec2 family competence protein [Paludisphaera soli]|uniref:ComEC/Rec2 family competence protein n=1 Tax=Paludisphaera soli TaxID=2712865 RepID=UPI001F0EC3F3|nr:ComEC/Rec2 family competence protein [Paludisphaera soli]